MLNKRWHWIVLCLIFLSLGVVIMLPIFSKDSFFTDYFSSKPKQMQTVGVYGDGDWDYYKNITISNKWDNAPIMLTVFKPDGNDDINNGIMDTEGHCRDDFNDLRFVYNNVTELPYWFQEIVTGSYCIVWINNSVNCSGFEVFYGNSSCTVNNSNITNTFTFGDDFNDDSLDSDKWDTITSGIVETNGNLELNYDASRGEIEGKTTFGTDMEIRGRIQWSDVQQGNQRFLGGRYSGDSNNRICWMGITVDNQAEMECRESGDVDDQGLLDVTSVTSYTIWQLFRNHTINVEGWQNNDLIATASTYVPTGDMEVWVIESTVDVGTVYLDWVFVRKHRFTKSPEWNGLSDEHNVANQSPVQSGEAPVDQSGGIAITDNSHISLYVVCTDPESDTMSAYWSSNSSGSWVQFAVNTSISSGTNITQDNYNFSFYNNRYWWRVNLSDGNGNWDNETYYLDTELIVTIGTSTTCGHTSHDPDHSLYGGGEIYYNQYQAFLDDYMPIDYDINTTISANCTNISWDRWNYGWGSGNMPCDYIDDTLNNNYTAFNTNRQGWRVPLDKNLIRAVIMEGGGHDISQQGNDADQINSDIWRVYNFTNSNNIDLIIFTMQPNYQSSWKDIINVTNQWRRGFVLSNPNVWVADVFMSNGTTFYSNGGWDGNEDYFVDANGSEVHFNIWGYDIMGRIGSSALNKLLNDQSNNVPSNVNPNPDDDATGVDLSPVCNVTVTDSDSKDKIMVRFYENSTGSFVFRHAVYNITVGNSVSFTFNRANSYNTKYWWRVNLSDSNGGWDNETYYFTTTSELINTSVDTITPYDQGTTQTVSIAATDIGDVPPGNVTLWYRWSDDNSSWDGGNSGWGNDTVDNNSSDVGSPTDRGTHSDFDNEKSKDATYDTLTEENMGVGNYVNDSVDSNTCDEGDPTDIGNETNFVNCQDDTPDSDYMNIQENNTGGVGVEETINLSSCDETTMNWDFKQATGDTEYLRWADDDFPFHTGAFIQEYNNGNKNEYWFIFNDTSETGDGFTVNFTFLCANHDGDADGFDVRYDDGSGGLPPTGEWGFNIPINAASDTYVYRTGTLPGTFNATQINNMKINLVTNMSGSGDDVWVDYVRMGISRAGGTNYETDFEYQWTSADNDETNEYVCIEVNDHTGNDNLNVDYWTGVGWSNLGTISSTGWNNFTATGLTGSTYTIRLDSTADSSDTTQDDWNIDVIKLYCYTSGSDDYELDLEVQWTDLQYTHDVEQLCIFTGTQNAEALKVDVWNTSQTQWDSLISDLSASTWNNISIKDWLTSSTFTIRYKASTETGDGSESSWEIDFAKVYYYNESGGSHGWNWVEWDNANNPDLDSPWAWIFDCPNETGYYEFYSIGNESGYANETAPGEADARCYLVYGSVGEEWQQTWINTFSFSNDADFQQTWLNTFSFSNDTVSFRQPWLNVFSFSNDTVSFRQTWINVFSFSNDTDFRQTWLNTFSFSNTTNSRQTWINVFSFSNDSVQQWLQTWINTFSFSNTTNSRQTWLNTFSFSNDTVSDRQTWLNVFSFSNDTVSNRQTWLNTFSFSSDVSFNQTWINTFSFSNTTNFRQTWLNIFSFSNDTFQGWEQIWLNTFSFSNTTNNRQTWLNTFSFSNDTVSDRQTWINTFSFSSDIDFRQTWLNTFSFSNDSLRQWQQTWLNTFTFSNDTYYNQIWLNIFSFSNDSVSDRQTWINTFSFSNDVAHNQIWISTFSFSNATSHNQTWLNAFSFSNDSVAAIIISNVYPVNHSVTVNLQPFMYATFNNTYGRTMNASWYYGPQGAENNLFETDTNFTNSTQTVHNYVASARATHYYWRIHVNDGTIHENYTYHFKTEGFAPGGGATVPQANIGAIGIIGILGIIGLLVYLRKKSKEDEL